MCCARPDGGGRCWPWLVASVLERLPGQMLTRDQLLMLSRDNVAAPGVPGLPDLGITPTPIDLIVPDYLRIYRPGGGRRVTASPRNDSYTDLSFVLPRSG